MLVRHVPQWVPGFGWKKGVAKMADTLTEMREMPFEFVKKQLVGEIGPWPDDELTELPPRPLAQPPTASLRSTLRDP